MKKQLLIKTLTAAVLSLSLAGASQAQTVKGAVNADNRFAVSVQYGTGSGSNNVVYTAPSNYVWTQTGKFTFSIDPKKDIKQCRINIAVWGDRATREGFAGVLTGNGGTVYSGQGFNGNLTSINAGGIGGAPSAGTFDAMTPATGGTLNTGPVSGHSTWGNRTAGYSASDFGGMGVPSNFNWVQPSNMSGRTTSNYMVFSTPCASVVKPPLVAQHMPGEHFQCYALEKGDRLKPETILLKDQFGESKAVLGTPRMLCNPSRKTHNRTTYERRNLERHLVCYDYAEKPRVEPQNLQINNQFAPDEVVSTRSEMFCVPSSKKHLDKGKPKETRFDRRDIRRRPEPRQQRR